MSKTPAWTTNEGKTPGEDRFEASVLPHARYFSGAGNKLEGNDLDLAEVLKKKAATAAVARDKFVKGAGAGAGRGGNGGRGGGRAGTWDPSTRSRGRNGGARTYDPAQYGLESDESIIWIEEPRRHFGRGQQTDENFAQV